MHMASYSSAGYALGPVVLPPTLVQRVHAAMDDVMAGRYETGQKPLRHEPPGFNPARDLTKIDQPHLANRTIFAAITQPAFGAAIAAITGARRVQVWAVQLLHKPGGSTATASVGWHQDFQYWHKWWTPDSRLFTAWLAISNVAADSGPMCFVPGSHRWGFLNAGNFFGDTGEKTRSQIRIPAGEHWAEVPATIPAGAFSVHHMLTYHGSHPNRESTPRRSFAVHLCAEGSTPLPGNTGHYDYVSHLDDPSTCPVIWDSPSSPTT